jgi:hypothetical protein
MKARFEKNMNRHKGGRSQLFLLALHPKERLANAFGSCAQKNSPPIPVTFSISSPVATPFLTTAPRSGRRGHWLCARLRRDA